MTIALAIPHTPWVPERVKSLHRLESVLGTDVLDIETNYTNEAMGVRNLTCRLFSDKEPNWSWSQKLWRWGIDSGADHLLQLQDDVIVDAGFWPNLREMIASVPDQIIGLESVHPVSRHLYASGKSWYTTSDGLIGVAYVIPRAALIEFEMWRASRLRPGWIGNVSEDTMIDLFCMSTGRRVWHPVPTIVDHDVALESTYGNDLHSHRRPIVTTVRGAEARGWAVPECAHEDISCTAYYEPPTASVSEHVCNACCAVQRRPSSRAEMGAWTVGRKVAFHVGRFYEHSPRMTRRWVKGFHMKDLEAALQDVRKA